MAAFQRSTGKATSEAAGGKAAAYRSNSDAAYKIKTSSPSAVRDDLPGVGATGEVYIIITACHRCITRWGVFGLSGRIVTGGV